MKTFFLLTSALAIGMVAAAQAQPPARRPGMAAETALRLRERLQLTEDQVTRLRAAREEAVAARRAEINEMLELRSRLRAGELTRQEFRNRVRSRAESLRVRLGARGDQVARILTETQREQLRELGRGVVRREAMRMRMRMRADRPWPGRAWGPAGPHGRHRSLPPHGRFRDRWPRPWPEEF
jgi:hypothetical protein